MALEVGSKIIAEYDNVSVEGTLAGMPDLAPEDSPYHVVGSFLVELSRDVEEYSYPPHYQRAGETDIRRAPTVVVPIRAFISSAVAPPNL